MDGDDGVVALAEHLLDDERLLVDVDLDGDDQHGLAVEPLDRGVPDHLEMGERREEELPLAWPALSASANRRQTLLFSLLSLPS